MPTSFYKLAKLCRNLEATTKRKEKTRLISEFLRSLDADEVAPATLLIVGQVFPEFDSRTMEVGWSTVKKVLEGGMQTPLLRDKLTVKSVHRTLIEIAEASGQGSRRLKSNLLEGLISIADSTEVEVLVRIIFKEMRIGVNEGLMLDGIADAASVDSKLVRRSLMLTGDLGEVARIALESGRKGLESIKMEVFVPLKPMLASMSYDVEEVIQEHGGETAFEYKLDGARIQIHRKGGEIRIFSRRLTDVTDSLPDIVELVKGRVKALNAVLEGEVVAIGERGKPLPFQDLMRRFTRVHNITSTSKEIPLELKLFDMLYLDGRILIDEPYTERRQLLESVCPTELVADKIVTGESAKALDFLSQAMKAGHEGLMGKRLDSSYTPGVRGKGWFKIKPVETLDLVIAAADWGYGRRTGWLSNYHLAAKDGEGFKVIGKTFKGLTDEEFKSITQRLQKLKVKESRHTVKVKPKVVVEVAFNEIQRSPKYKAGFALRFARILQIRDDKAPEDVDTIGRVRELYEKQFEYKAKFEN
jgi:DNA ligase-1